MGIDRMMDLLGKAEGLPGGREDPMMFKSVRIYEEAPPAPAIHSGVAVVITPAPGRGTFYVARRKAGCKVGVGVVALPGGKVNHGETLHDAIVREALEETGLIVVPRVLPSATGVIFHVGERIRGGEHHISYYAVANAVGGTLRNAEPDKHSDWEETTIERLREQEAGGLDHWVPLDAIERLRTQIGV